MVGNILGNRYHLQELIGEGGMALVYKAECSLLCRAVAVKILRPQYANDVDFVERFRREARAAASLSHPNVINAYDVGQENGIDYIVMEYIPGENLKELIRREAPFSIKTSLEITKQIAEALYHAHQRNIIHRDIKPHNILITPTGQIKVTDFGIARAISAGSLTQTGEVLGSVQYSSPEQAKGDSVGPQSDIYSLGCVLYEMLTGKVPFEGDTAVAIALQHIKGEYVPIRQLRPDIPASLENLVNKAMACNPEERYISALALLKDLSAIQVSLGMSTDFNAAETDLPTQVWNTVTEPEAPKHNPKWWLWILGGVGAGVVLITLFGFLFFNMMTPKRSIVSVPNLVGKDLVDAKSILQEKQLILKVLNQSYNSSYPINTIISQTPAAGLTKRVNSEIGVVVSKGPQLVRVPNLIGKNKIEAELALDEVRLKLGEVLTDYSSEQPEGAVIKQLPEQNTQIELGARVSITINNAAQNTIQVPNFIGRPLAEVQAELTGLGLVYNQAKNTSSDVYPQGVIVDQDPVPYTEVASGTAMNFMVSSGSTNIEEP